MTKCHLRTRHAPKKTFKVFFAYIFPSKDGQDFESWS